MPLQAMVGAAQLLMRIVRSACFCIHAAFIQEGFVPHQPVMQVLDKAVFAATRQRQRKRPQLACRLTFRLFGQVADDDLDLVKLAHLHRNIGEGLQQPAASVADIVKSLTKSNKDKEPKQQGIHISQPPLFPQPLDPCPCLLYWVEIRAIGRKPQYPACPSACNASSVSCRLWKEALSITITLQAGSSGSSIFVTHV